MVNIFFAHPDQKIIDLYQPHLKKHFFVDSATNGLIALRKIRLVHPRLIISEVNLPFLSGLGLLKYVRSHPSLSAVPFLFLSNSNLADQALSQGANDFIDFSQSSPKFLINKSFHHLTINSHLLKRL